MDDQNPQPAPADRAAPVSGDEAALLDAAQPPAWSLGHGLTTVAEDSHGPGDAEEVERPSGSVGLGGAVLYPNCYTWFVLLAALDIMLTTLIIAGFEGYEVNVVADWIIAAGGLRGVVAFKFGVVIMVVLICELVGRRHVAKGRKLAEWAVAITCIPVAVALIQIAVVTIAALRAGSPPE